MTQGTPTEAREQLRVDQIDAAITRARTALLASQRPDGSWNCDTDIGPIGPASQVIVENLFGKLSHSDASLALKRFSAWQLPDGSFEPYPYASVGSVTVTALVWAAALACGARADAPLVRRAWAYVEANGGLDAVKEAFRKRSDLTALYLLAAGHLDDASFLPHFPPGTAFLSLERLVGRYVHAGNVMGMMVIVALVDQYSRKASGPLSRARQALESRRIRSYLCGWQNADGSWNGSPLQTCLMLLGLHAAGMTAEQIEIKRGLAWLDSMKRRTDQGLDVCAMDNDVWSTALAAMALHSAGLPAETGPIARAQDHLLATQTREPMPRANQRKPKASRTGGWPFQRGNFNMPDTDDTGVVLAALASLNSGRGPRDAFRAIDRGVEWLRDMQNPDGGFPTFVWGLPSKKPGPMFMTDLPAALDDLRTVGSLLKSPPPELGDPSLEGVTGRVLWGLGKAGVSCDEPWIREAIAFLKRQQCENGSWWGRWKVCYLAETATILLGLGAVGEEMNASYITRAVQWIASCQNSDGGFGESPGAYRNPQLAGQGPSMPPVTAYVLLGLLATRNAPSDVLDRAAQYLVKAQRAEGLWSSEGWLHTFIPPDLLYTYDLTAHALPLLALSELRRSGSGAMR